MGPHAAAPKAEVATPSTLEGRPRPAVRARDFAPEVLTQGGSGVKASTDLTGTSDAPKRTGHTHDRRTGPGAGLVCPGAWAGAAWWHLQGPHAGAAERGWPSPTAPL